MDNLRLHGQPPFRIAVVHGGPGAQGEMYAVAREISAGAGVLEPLQTAGSVGGHVEELRHILENQGSPPLVLIGFSWGAWLSYILTAHQPSLVQKLILVSSGPFTEQYAAGIMETRLRRLNAAEKQEALSLMSALDANNLDDEGLARFGELMYRADACDPLPQDSTVAEARPVAAVFQQVWRQAGKLRSSGELLRLGERIRCPVVAIHGDYDSHPGAGVREPLSRVVKDFRFILLERCGHYPWRERHARDEFYRILREETGLDADGQLR